MNNPVMIASDTARGFAEVFGESRRRKVAKARVAPLTVIENSNVFLDRGHCIGQAGKATLIDQLHQYYSAVVN